MKVTTRDPAGPRDWLLPAALGAAAGFVAGWFLTRRPGKVSGELRGDAIAWHDRLGERMGDGVDAALGGLRDIRARVLPHDPPDPSELEARLALVTGSAAIRVHHLGDGIVELTGSASDEAARAAAAGVARVPGVRTVLNRVWTPSSAVPGAN